MTTTDIATTDIATFDFVPGLPVDELHRELDVANTISSLGRRKLALYLGDMEVRGVFALTGHSSAVHYARTRLQLARRRAEELVRIGRQLGELPEIDAALVAGDIGWSKLRYVLRVVVPETQTEWLARADQSNCDVLSIDVARHAPGERPRQRNPGGLEDLFMTVRARLRLTNHEMWEQAKKKISAERRMRVTNEDMMIYAARLILSTDAVGKADDRTAVKHSPFQLIVHQDAAGTRVHTEHGDVEVREDQAARIRAQAEVVAAAAPVAESVAEPATESAGKTSVQLVRRILARDDRCCQNCGRTLYLHVHHVVFRARGGATVESNLVSVCSFCHSLIHAGLLQLHGAREGGFVFLDRSGEAVTRRSPPGSPPQLPAVCATAPRSKRDAIIRSLRMVRARRELAPSWGIDPGSDDPWLDSWLDPTPDPTPGA